MEINSADLLTCGMLTYVIKSMFTVFGMIEQRKPIISKKKKKKKQAW